MRDESTLHEQNMVKQSLLEYDALRTTYGERGTTFAGRGPLVDESLTPDPIEAESLRTRDYW